MGQNSIEYFLKSIPQVTFKETFKNYKFESKDSWSNFEVILVVNYLNFLVIKE